MSLSLSSVWGSIENAVSNNNSVKMAVTSGLGYLEQKTIGVLQKSEANLTGQAQQAASQMLSQPTNPNGFGAYFENILKTPVLNKYGPYVLVGIGVIAVAAIWMVKR